MATGSTPNHGIKYPVALDEVALVNDFKELADSADAAIDTHIDQDVSTTGSPSFSSGLVQTNDPGAVFKITNDNITDHALLIERTASSTATSDPEIFVIYYDGKRSTWTNEKGNLRTSNEASPFEDAFKIIGSADESGNYLRIIREDGTDIFRVGNSGKVNAYKGLTMQDNLIELVAEPVSPQDAATKQYVDNSGGGGGTYSSPTLIVASNDAPQAVKDSADYECTGTNDHVEIQQAIDAAAGTQGGVDSGLDGIGHVILTAGRYDIASTVIMKTGVWLQGQGQLTEFKASSSITSGTEVVGIEDSNVHYSKLSDFWINGNGTSGDVHGIHYDATGGGDFSVRPDTNPDSYNRIENMFISDCKSGSSGASGRHGIWMEGNSGGSRASKLIGNHIWIVDGYGIWMDGTSDCHLSDNTVNTDSSVAENAGSHGFVINGGNTQVIGCKAYYCEGHGFEVRSSRVMLVNCVAQDNGNWGFNVTNGYCSIIGGQADSNGRLWNGLGAVGQDSLGGGGLITNQKIVIQGLHIFDRVQPGSLRQSIGMQFTGAITRSLISARVELHTDQVQNGTTVGHVIGESNLTDSRNVVNIVRSGSTTPNDLEPIIIPAVIPSFSDGTISLGVGIAVPADTPANATIVRY
jgi:hypothetical protein